MNINNHSNTKISILKYILSSLQHTSGSKEIFDREFISINVDAEYVGFKVVFNQHTRLVELALDNNNRV